MRRGNDGTVGQSENRNVKMRSDSRDSVKGAVTGSRPVCGKGGEARTGSFVLQRLNKAAQALRGALMFAMCYLTLFSMVILIILGSHSTPRAQPLRSKVEVDCGVLQKNLDGFWTLRHETTVNEGIYSFVLKPGTFRKTMPTYSGTIALACSSKIA